MGKVKRIGSNKKALAGLATAFLVLVLVVIGFASQETGGSDGAPSTMEAVGFERESAVKYHVHSGQREYLVFTVAQKATNEHWEYDGQQSMNNLGFMPAFGSEGDGGELVYTRFYHVHLPCYMVSLITLAAMAGFHFFRYRT